MSTLNQSSQETTKLEVPEPGPEQRNGHNHEQDQEPGPGSREPVIPPKEYKLTQFGNVERMMDRYGQDIRWSKAFGFTVWDGKRWQRDKDTLVERFAWLTVRSLYQDASAFSRLAAQCEDEETRKRYANKAIELNRFAKFSEGYQMIAAMLKLARHKCEVDTKIFDHHITSIYKLNFQNGTLDMTPGNWQFYVHRREDYLTKVLTFNYNPHMAQDAGYLFDAFLEDITCGDKELARYIRKALGLALTAYTKEEAWFLLLGQGENGKTTLFDLITFIMGEYAVRVDEKTISVSNMNRGGSIASPDIARLKGMRLAVVAETEEGAVLATSRLKDMASGEQVTARYLNRDNFEFYQTHKIFIYTNHIPQVRDNSHGFWRRVSLIPFNYTVPSEKKDKNLIFDLQKEAEYVLAWMIEGERLRQQEGMERPVIVQQVTKQYRESQDVLGQFIRDCCVVDAGEWIAARLLQDAFKEWLEKEMNMKPLTTQVVGRMMSDHGFERKHTREGKVYIGLRMRKVNEPFSDNSVTVTDGDGQNKVSALENFSIEQNSEISVTSVTPSQEAKSSRFSPEIDSEMTNGEAPILPKRPGTDQAEPEQGSQEPEWLAQHKARLARNIERYDEANRLPGEA